MKHTNKRTLTVLAALVLVLGAGALLWRTAERARGMQAYSKALELADIDRAAEPAPGAAGEFYDPYAAALAAVNLDALQEVNGDVFAWVDIPDTELSYPILQAEDNQYYLSHTWQDEKNSIGAVFMECQCAPDFSDFNTLLYGHRMRNGSMFGSLKNYSDQAYWEAHPRFYIADETGVSVYDIFAAHQVGVREIVYRLGLEKAGLEEELIRYCLDHSVIDTGIVPEASDKLVTLSTCTGSGHAARWVVQGVLRGRVPAA